MDRNFRQMLEARWASGTLACVGLDVEVDRIPRFARRAGNETDFDVANSIVAFNSAIVDATKDLVCAFKPNMGFYMAEGISGMLALMRTIAYIRAKAPDVPVILDAKIGDIDNSARAYGRGIFDQFRADAVTVSPYLGGEALVHLMNYPEKGILVLVRTSNVGSDEFQGLGVQTGGPLYENVAYQFRHKWNVHGNCGVVAGATNPRDLGFVRGIVGEMPILCPGVGAQDGDLRAAIESGIDDRGLGLIVNSSRSVIFASGGDDFAEAARNVTIRLRDDINRFRGA